MQKNILVIDDDDAIRESLCELLDSEGFHVTSATNGQTALSHLNSDIRLPDLILVDLMMPVMDGIQFCKEKELIQRISHIPVVIMSADGQIKAKQENSGAIGHLRKPADIDVIIETVKRFCK